MCLKAFSVNEACVSFIIIDRVEANTKRHLPFRKPFIIGIQKVAKMKKKLPDLLVSMLKHLFL